MDIICMGEILIDFTPGKEPHNYTANPGGAPANVAVATARNGIDTAFLGVMGNDDFGKRLKGVLEADGIQVLKPELTDEAVTTMAFVTLYEGGERSFTFVRKPGADILLAPEDVKEEDVAVCRMFHSGSVSLSDAPSKDAVYAGLKMASDMGKMVSFDVNYRDMIWHDVERCKKEVDKILPFVDFLKISDEELFFVGGEEKVYATMEKFGLKVVVETLGSKGAKYFYNGKSVTIEGHKVNAVDATGAGDAFWGGFLSRILMEDVNSVEEVDETLIKTALEYGNAAGALCVQKLGGIPALPKKEDILATL